MFETAELGRKVDKDTYNETEPTLRVELLELQRELRELGDFPVIVVFAGVDGAGKGMTVNKLNEWMDPRWLINVAYRTPSEEERERPRFWRYWRDLPPKGQIGLFLSSWYSGPLLDRVYGKIDDAALDTELHRIAGFEDELAEDGAVILKFWMHLSRKQQSKRLTELEEDELNSWRVDDRARKHLDMYDDFLSATERTIRRTSTGPAPWILVEGSNRRYRELTVATAIRDAVRKRIAEAKAAKQAPKAEAEASTPSGITQPTILDSLKMDQPLTKKEFKKEFEVQRARVGKLYRAAKERGIASVLMFEGWDAAGKGGGIRRLVSSMEARDYRVIPVAAPTQEERAQHYLWRFWRHLGRDGRVTVFDRSWYGRVLVERVEGFATEAEWQRAYAEINHFEEQITDHGSVLMKYWVHITPDEQLARFEARKLIPWKAWKLTDEDWRNREKWDEYAVAINDLVERTSTSTAPWTLVEGNNKNYGRLKIITSYADALEKRLSS